MGLRFIYGRSGSGKTNYCLQEIKQCLQNKTPGSLVLLVPEQYTFQAERELVRVLAVGGILETEVLSFRRLAFRIFNEAGGITFPHLHSAGKCMLVYKVLNKMKDELPIFAKTADRQGFVNTMAALITEFKRYNVNPRQLEAVGQGLEKDDTLLSGKITELAGIYKEYEELLSRAYRDADDDLAMAATKMESTDLYRDAEIWIDGFSGFTPQEYELIAKLGARARRVNICLCTDSLTDMDGAEGTDVFAAVKECGSRLSRLAAETGLGIEEPVGLSTSRPLARFANSPELGHLEENFFAYPHRTYTGMTQDLVLFSSLNIFAEIEAAARDIIRLCRDKGRRYRDITLLTGDLENYAGLIEAVFNEYEIPYFLDRKVEITQNPLIRLVLSMLDIFIDNWSYQAVFRYLKTGLTGLERESIDRIENYVLACGIRGSRWTREEKWQTSTELLSWDGEAQTKNGELEDINEVRLKITAPLLAFRQKTKGKKRALDFCSALFEFLETIGVPVTIEKQIEEFRGSGQLALADEYAQIWNILMEVLDQTVEVLGEEAMGVEKFASVLQTGLGEYQLGLIPASLDQVLVGSVHRSLSHDVKALFILGANDGIFPAAALEEGVLSDADRSALRKLGVELASDTRTKAFDEQYLIYRALTTPDSYLRISWPLADSEGRSLRPSMIISRIRKLFPEITETSDILEPSSTREEIELIAGRPAAFRHMASHIGRDQADKEDNSLWREVYRWYAEQEEWQPHCRALRSVLAYRNVASAISPEKIQDLYGNPMKASVSRLEKFSACAFAYYLQYGLKARERKVFRLTPPDVGTFIHTALEIFSREVVERDLSWRDLDRKWCEEEVSLIVDGMLENMQGAGIAGSKRMTALMLRLKRVITRAVWLIAEHIRRSGFEPVGYEIGFGEGEKLPPLVIELEEGRKVNLSGRIDRVDALKTAEGTYLRIVDYKSGSKDFQLEDVYYGLQIQLVTYLDALKDCSLPGTEGNILPGGIFYLRLDDPIIKAAGQTSQEEVERAIMKQLKMKGLLLADVKLVKEMDREIDGQSLIIPARLNKGDVLGKSSAATLEQFSVLQVYVSRLLKQLCGEINAGTVSIQPWKKKTFTACQYCDFAAVCQFDSRLKENRYRIITEHKEDEIWRLMTCQESGETDAGQ